MNGRAGTTRITLGAVVLDSPDHSGRYVARDIMGGWAYMVADREGDTRARGNGGCPGGIDAQLRCAFLLAVNQAADSARLMVVVDSRKAHRTMVEMGRNDPQVMEAIDGRPVSVMTRPDERASMQVRSAAERAASAVLQERERADWIAIEDGRSGAAARRAADTAAATEEAAAAPVAQEPSAPVPPPAHTHTHTEPGRGWRSRARGHAEAAALPPGTPAPRNTALTDWLRDFDRRVTEGAARGTGPDRESNKAG